MTMFVWLLNVILIQFILDCMEGSTGAGPHIAAANTLEFLELQQ